MRENLSFGVYANKKVSKRIHAILPPFSIFMPGDPLEVSQFVYVYIDPKDDKLKARLNKDLIKKRGADEYCAKQNVYEVFENGHPDDIATEEDVERMTSAAAYTHMRFADIHYKVFSIIEEQNLNPYALLNYDKFVKFKGADNEGLTVNFEFSRDPFNANRAPSTRKGILGALERFAEQGEIQEAKLKNAEAFDFINKFEEKHGLKRGWETVPMDCRTEDGVKRLKLILELDRELNKKMLPPDPPKKQKRMLSEEEAEKWEEIIANNQRFGFGNW